MRNLYVYADETEHQISHDRHLIGAGLLVCERPVGLSIISTALAGLEADSDRHKNLFRKRDSRTLVNQHFHASDDSQNGHSHFCRSISSSIMGSFFCSYSVVSPARSQSVSSMQEVELALNTIRTLTPETCIRLCVEARPQFGADALDRWAETFYQTIDHSIADTPMLPAIFPRIELASEGKENPGLQVVDFLLWAMNRTHFDQPDYTWFRRLGLRPLNTFKRDGGKEYGGSYFLKKGISASDRYYPEDALNMALALANNEQMVHAYLIIERAIRGIYLDSLPVHIAHFTENVRVVQCDLRDLSGFLPENLERLCSLFVRMFDTAPLYGDMTSLELKEAAAWLRARRLAALSLRSDQGHGMRCRDFFMRIRRKIARLKPELLFPDSVLPA